MMRYPFALKDKRFRWQESKNLAEKMELNGTLSRKYTHSQNRNISEYTEANNNSGLWESLIQKTEPNKKPKTRSVR